MVVETGLQGRRGESDWGDNDLATLAPWGRTDAQAADDVYATPFLGGRLFLFDSAVSESS